MYVVIAISHTSNSSPRTMRRKASMRGSTSMNSNSQVRGFTVPSLRALLFPWVRVTILSLSSGIGSSVPFKRRRSWLVLLPWHERRVDDARHALAADRPDGQVHIFESKPVRRELLQRKAPRCELLQSKLACLEAVPARAFDGDGFRSDPADREIRKFRHLSLDHHRPAPALERFHAEQYWEGPGAGGAVENDVHALATRDLFDARER